MKAMNLLSAALACSALVLFSSDSYAWFRICNAKANGASMYVTYAYYEPNTTTLYSDACSSYTRVFPPQFYTAWKNTGWWHLNQNECATVYGPALANTWGYVYAQISDGSTLTGANVPFQVASSAFGMDQYSAGPFGTCSGECIAQQGEGSCGSPGPTYWNVNTFPVSQDSYQNYTFTIQ
jgi:uncharacterized membrane protein